MSANRNERRDLAVVIMLSLFAAFLLQTTRVVRSGLPGTMPQSQQIAAPNDDPMKELPRYELSKTELTQLSPLSMP